MRTSALKSFIAILIIWSFASACGVGERKDKPEDVVWAMFKAAGKGDADGYLSCFSQSFKERLGSTAAEMGADQFSRYLMETDRSIMGIAITGKERISEDEIKLRVELVFKDKNDVQKLTLRKESGAWKIGEMGGSARIKTLIPYGTELYPIGDNQE